METTFLQILRIIFFLDFAKIFYTLSIWVRNAPSLFRVYVLAHAFPCFLKLSCFGRCGKVSARPFFLLYYIDWESVFCLHYNITSLTCIGAFLMCFVFHVLQYIIWPKPRHNWSDKPCITHRLCLLVQGSARHNNTINLLYFTLHPVCLSPCLSFLFQYCVLSFLDTAKTSFRMPPPSFCLYFITFCCVHHSEMKFYNVIHVTWAHLRKCIILLPG